MPVRLATLIALIALSWLPQAGAAISVNSARIWPAQDYTRLTLESSKPIDYAMFTVGNPDRLVVDLNNVALHGALDSLAGKISGDDPYIKSVRVGQFKRGVVRLVLDLKTAVKPQLFSLKPVAEYGYRLVLDVYPAVPADPLMTLALQSENKLSLGSASAPEAASSPATAPEAEAAAPPAPSLVAPAAQPAVVPPAATPGTNTGRTESRKDHGEKADHALTIVIDAGHGGEDPGARGHHGAREKDVTLAIARRLKEEVNNTDGMRAVMTRDGDYFIPLGGRVEKARKAHADLFVSIHADAYIKSNANGSSVFALSEHGATSAAARWLAKNENEADLIGGVNINTKDPYLARTLLDLSQTAQITDSLKLARQVLHELGGINSLHRGRVEQAGFAVLKAPDIPSILVETAFISNPREEKRLRSEEYQTQVARAILGGIKHYLAQNPPVSRPKIAENN
jgi:N-acetylmuramoyl-L-alanine amidase